EIPAGSLPCAGTIEPPEFVWMRRVEDRRHILLRNSRPLGDLLRGLSSPLFSQKGSNGLENALAAGCEFAAIPRFALVFCGHAFGRRDLRDKVGEIAEFSVF